MKAEFLRVINKVCKASDIDLRISDIKAYKEIKADDDLYETIILLCRNEREMFEFMMVISELPDYYNVTVEEVDGSPYSCDSFNIHIEK